MTQIDELFDRMDAWRHFPGYQLERRTDVYFSPYLVEVLEANLGFSLRPELVPEFPVRIGTIYPHRPTNASYKLDYLAASVDHTKAVLVELKTDQGSRRSKQDEYLLAAQEVGLHQLLEGLLDLFRATRAKRKYLCLLKYLEKMDLLRIPGTMREIMARPTLQGVSATSREIEIRIASPESLIMYVQPNGERPNVIIFRGFAEIVRRHDDNVSQRFAQSLLEWARIEAGEKTERNGAW